MQNTYPTRVCGCHSAEQPYLIVMGHRHTHPGAPGGVLLARRYLADVEVLQAHT